MRPSTAQTRFARWLFILCMVVSARAECDDYHYLTTDELLSRFETPDYFWRQFEVAREIAARGDRSVLPRLEKWLRHEDRHSRANAGFLFAKLGDDRGFEVIVDILNDYSDRAPGQGSQLSSDGRYRVELQIRSDRYSAAHRLGDLKDPRAVEVLIPLLHDPDVDYIVPWSLSQIGDKKAIKPLIEMLNDPDPSLRVLSILALDGLRATEAAPKLRELLDDHTKSTFGQQVTVADAALAALEKLNN